MPLASIFVAGPYLADGDECRHRNVGASLRSDTTKLLDSACIITSNAPKGAGRAFLQGRALCRRRKFQRFDKRGNCISGGRPDLAECVRGKPSEVYITQLDELDEVRNCRRSGWSIALDPHDRRPADVPLGIVHQFYQALNCQCCVCLVQASGDQSKSACPVCPLVWLRACT
jgi:hypothetical protein